MHLSLLDKIVQKNNNYCFDCRCDYVLQIAVAILVWAYWDYRNHSLFMPGESGKKKRGVHEKTGDTKKIGIGWGGGGGRQYISFNNIEHTGEHFQTVYLTRGN